MWAVESQLWTASQSNQTQRMLFLNLIGWEHLLIYWFISTLMDPATGPLESCPDLLGPHKITVANYFSLLAKQQCTSPSALRVFTWCTDSCTDVKCTWRKLWTSLVMNLYCKCGAKLLLESSSTLGDSWRHQWQHLMMVIPALSDHTVKLECQRGLQR